MSRPIDVDDDQLQGVSGNHDHENACQTLTDTEYAAEDFLPCQIGYYPLSVVVDSGFP